MIAIVFPGQGSQSRGMGQDLYERFEPARSVFRDVSDATGRDLPTLCFETDDEVLRQTENAQIALYTVGLAAFTVLKHGAPATTFRTFAGHSIGEFCALCAAGAFSIGDGAKMVRKRGELMAGAGTDRAGAMAAVIGLDRATLDAICRETSQEGLVVVIANDNCPGQLVISGDVSAVEAASDRAKAGGARLVQRLPVSGAFHSPLMAEPAAAFEEVLRTFEFKSLGNDATVFANVDALPYSEDADFASILCEQLRSPVRWTELVTAMAASGVTRFVECGAGDKVSGMIKRIAPQAERANVFDSASLEATLRMLEGVPA